MKHHKNLKVNLGSGTDYLEGWINVDIDKNVKADVRADLHSPFPFSDNSVDELKASDILEHFTKEDGEAFLRECYRVLKPNGKLFLRTHNLFQIIKQFKNDPQVMIHFIYGNTTQTGVFGSHKFAYTEQYLKKIMKRVGFKISKLEKITTNFEITAEKIEINNNLNHIAIIQQTPDIGGAELYMYNLSQEFTKNGYNLSVASNLDKFLFLFNKKNVTLTKIPIILDIIGNWKGLVKSLLYLPFALYFYVSLLGQYKKEKVDVILMSGFSEKLLVSFLSLFFDIPIVWIEYAPLEVVFKRNFKIPEMLYRLLHSIPQSVIVPTQLTKNYLMARPHVSLSKIVVIPCGVKIPENIQKKKNVDLKNAFVIGNVSRATREKGQQFLIEAMPDILKKVPNAHLILIGDGPDKEYFQSLVVKFELENFVTILGFVDSLTKYYPQMDVFVFPTVWDLEGFGLVLIEAMSYELPVIASNIGPVPEIIQDKETGILVPPRNANQLAKEIIYLAKNNDKRKKLGQNGRKRVESFFSLVDSAEKINRVLQDATL